MSIRLYDLANDLIDVLSEAAAIAEKLNDEIIKQEPDNLGSEQVVLFLDGEFSVAFEDFQRIMKAWLDAIA